MAPSIAVRHHVRRASTQRTSIMVRKPKPKAGEKAAFRSGLFDSALAGTVKDSAQQIWLAGLGAFSKAQEEGGKVFDALVKEGATLQRKTQAAAEEKIGEVRPALGQARIHLRGTHGAGDEEPRRALGQGGRCAGRAHR
jgi:hypothetical protein